MLPSPPVPEEDVMTLTPEMRAQVFIEQLHAAGLTPEDLVRIKADGGLGGPSVSEFIAERVRPATSAGSWKVWYPYYALVEHGYPDLCACMCEACLACFNGSSRWQPCPCVASGACGCSREDLQAGPVSASSCLEHHEGHGDAQLASLRLADLEHLSRWAKLRAAKRAAVRRSARAASGRPAQAYDGRSAVEHLRNALSHLYRLARGDRILGIEDNLALELRPVKRTATVARAFTEAQLGELWNAIFTSGGQDPDLDMLIVWLQLETGARRGGPIGLRIGDLLVTSSQIRLGEKDGKVDLQPASDELIASLIAHALQRGDVVVGTADGLEPIDVTVEDVYDGRARLRTDAPVLYYRPRRAWETHTDLATGEQRREPVLDADGEQLWEPHPLTRRRFNSLWDRLKRELPWLDEIHGRPHDLRHTGATFVERAYGYAVAQRWLRHSSGEVTGTYIAATDDEVRAAHQWLTGAARDDHAQR
jgi:integrase/recombinase XerC